MSKLQSLHTSICKVNYISIKLVKQTKLCSCWVLHKLKLCVCSGPPLTFWEPTGRVQINVGALTLSLPPCFSRPGTMQLSPGQPQVCSGCYAWAEGAGNRPGSWDPECWDRNLDGRARSRWGGLPQRRVWFEEGRVEALEAMLVCKEIRQEVGVFKIFTAIRHGCNSQARDHFSSLLNFTKATCSRWIGLR